MPPQTEGWRDLSKWERETLERMLQEAFDGRDALLTQLASARVRTIDEEGSVQFDAPLVDTSQGPRYRNPVVARGQDQDGIPIEMVLLVGEDGRINELDIWKGDGSAIRKRPKASSLQIVIR